MKTGYLRIVFFLAISLFVVYSPMIGQELVATKAKKATKPKVLYGLASYYANKFEGRRTASGEIFRQKNFTCACNRLPLGTRIKVTNIRNKRSIIVRVNDRLHPRMKRIVDLTRAGAKKLGFLSSGLARVKVEVL